MRTPNVRNAHTAKAQNTATATTHELAWIMQILKSQLSTSSVCVCVCKAQQNTATVTTHELAWTREILKTEKSAPY